MNKQRPNSVGPVAPDRWSGFIQTNLAAEGGAETGAGSDGLSTPAASRAARVVMEAPFPRQLLPNIDWQGGLACGDHPAPGVFRGELFCREGRHGPDHRERPNVLGVNGALLDLHVRVGMVTLVSSGDVG